MSITLYNTLTRKIEEFKPIKSGFVGMYTCGMTVYDHTHLGHMRTYVNTDLLRRMLEYNSLEVKQVENVTDVGHLTSDADSGEDKLQKKARAERMTAWEIARIYTQEFFGTLEALNIIPPKVIAKATEHIPGMIQLIQALEEKEFTYIIPDDGVYFDTSKLTDYGKLAGLKIEGLKAGARVEMISGKRNITDFALWKFSKEEEKRDMEWESPWSKKGFPGWHIECSTLVMKYLSGVFDEGKFNPDKFETVDIHTGGIDHIPVHHTNEIAQTEAATGKKFVNYWFHNAFLVVEGEKMSKSLGNFFWMKDIRDRRFDPLTLRYLFLTAHYRSKMNFTWKGLEAAASGLEKLRGMVWELKEKQKERSMLSQENLTKVEKYRTKFLGAINNDLKLPEALAVVWELIKSNVPAYDKLDLLLDFDQVLGLRLAEVSSIKYQVPSEVKELVEKREELRKQDKWKEADEIRKEVERLGWKIEDTEKGSKLRRKEKVPEVVTTHTS